MKIRKIYEKTLKLAKSLKHLIGSEVRICKCCCKKTVIVSLSKGEERKICIRCRANLRYELICSYLREFDLSDKTIVELDSRSPLRSFLNRFDRYTRTYYSVEDRKKAKGGIIYNKDGVRCEDVTCMTFENNSVDFIISSDVLEHVPDINKAFIEMARVLKVGGKSIFTVPNQRDITRQRAYIENNKIVYIESPEYHSDPIAEKGILVFWDFGLDIEKFAPDNLKIYFANEPAGLDKRILWIAEKV